MIRSRPKRPALFVGRRHLPRADCLDDGAQCLLGSLLENDPIDTEFECAAHVSDHRPPADQDGREVLESRANEAQDCLLYTSPSPRDISGSRMPSSA